MKTDKLFEVSPEDSLSVSFRRKDVSESQIKAHWQKIMNEIAKDEADGKEDEELYK